MTTPNDTDTISRPLWRDILEFCRARITGRHGLLTLATAGALAGIVLNWNWLVAVGIAPVLVAVLPCLVMCGLGLCMNRMTGWSCESAQPSANADSDTGITALLDTGPFAGSVPVVRPRPVPPRRKQPVKKRTKTEAIMMKGDVRCEPFSKHSS